MIVKKVKLSKEQLEAFAGCYVLTDGYIKPLGDPNDTTADNFKVFCASHEYLEALIYTADDFEFWEEAEQNFNLDTMFIECSELPIEVKEILYENLRKRYPIRPKNN